MHYSKNKNGEALLYLGLSAITLFLFLMDGQVESWVTALHKLEAVRPALEFVTSGMRFLSQEEVFLGAAVLLFAAARLLKIESPRLGRSIVAGFLFSGAAVQILKHLIGRARPSLDKGLAFIGPNIKHGYDSFPSGHTTEAFCFACMLSFYFPRYRVLFYGYAVMVALSRVEKMAHFTSDIGAGIILGLLCGKAVIWFFNRKKEKALPSAEAA